jgi:DNA-binding MarR family transcriptional regulator
MLEERGLAKREAHEVDRRLKNLVLTEEGLELKQQLEELLGAQMPWSQALDTSERQHLLELIRKMTKAATSAPAPICGGESVGEVNARLGTASPAAM